MRPVPQIVPAYLPPRESAAYLGISLSQLWRWERRGLLRIYRTGGVVRCRVVELDEAMTSNRTGRLVRVVKGA